MSFAARVFMLCLLGPLMLGAVREPGLARVLERMRAASGSPFGTHVVSTYRRAGGSGEVVMSDSQGLRFFIRQCRDTLCFGTYFDGYRLYDVNMNATALPRSSGHEVALRGLRSIAGGAFLQPSFTREGGRIADGGRATFGGIVYRRLVVDQPDADGMDVLVDPRTWLVAEVRDLAVGEGMSLRDYRKVGPLTLPFESVRYGGPVTRYEDRHVAGEPLVAPHGLVPQAGSAPTDMALDAGGGTPVGSCELGGIATKCLLDTGNSGIAISLELAEQLHANPIGAFEVSGLGDYATEVVRAGPLIVGNMHFPEAAYVVLHDIHRYGYDIVLGADVIASTRLSIDYARHAITFNAPADVSEGVGIPLSFENFVPVTDVGLGSLSARLAVDTGDQSAINLAYGYFSSHSDLFKATRVQAVSGVGGSSFEYIGEIPMVTVGDYRISAQPIGTTRTLRGTAQGHLGAGVLAHFRVVLDYARSRMTLFARDGDRAVLRVPPAP